MISKEKKAEIIAVGRVMTCVLGMVVIREREIRNFVETPFYRVVGSFTDANIEAEWKVVEGSKYFESPLLYKENGFKKQESAENLIQELSGKTAVVESIERGTSRKKAPLLFNLAELQAECSKRFKISPDETLQVAQDLYEKKLTTYPRTDARVLSTAVAKEIGKNISSRLYGTDYLTQLNLIRKPDEKEFIDFFASEWRPEMIGYRPGAQTWSVWEAKGGSNRREQALKKGAQQLEAIGTVNGAGPDPGVVCMTYYDHGYLCGILREPEGDTEGEKIVFTPEEFYRSYYKPICELFLDKESGLRFHDSNADVVIEYQGEIREDVFFDMLHENGC